MKHTVSYLVAAAVLSAAALLLRGWGLVLLWPAVASLLVGLAYAGLGPRAFGKRPDGRLAWWTYLLLLPYLGFTFAIWKLKRRYSKEAYHDEIVPGLWVGRRVLGDELPDGVALVVDVAAEFAEPSSVLAKVAYRSFPILNYAAPAPAALRQLAAELRDHPGGLYIHCAQGHGRSATVAAALLLARGHAATPEEAVSLVVKARPKVHLEACQQAALEAAAREM